MAATPYKPPDAKGYFSKSPTAKTSVTSSTESTIVTSAPLNPFITVQSETSSSTSNLTRTGLENNADTTCEQSVNVSTNANQSKNCSCSKIGIMHLFHEMKQEFPTVPDNIVSEYVSNNCHDRAACFKSLMKVAANYPGSVQAYPAALRQNSFNIFGNSANKLGQINQQGRKTSIPTLPATSGNQQQQFMSATLPRRPAPPPPVPPKRVNSTSNELNQKSNNCIDQSLNINDNNCNQRYAIDNNDDQPIIQKSYAQRPTTLSLASNDQFQSNNNRAIDARPSRTAPPPPTQSTNTPPLHQNNRQFGQQQYSVPSASSNLNGFGGPNSSESTPSDASSGLNLSLNVTVSPVSGKPPHRPPRHTTALSVQPEFPFVGATGLPPSENPNSPTRSYTSVNFTLRQPAGHLLNNPPSPIDISAGPSLTYSSSTYDARKGYQSRLQITVGGTSPTLSGSSSGGGSITAVRTRPRSCYDLLLNDPSEDNYDSRYRQQQQQYASTSDLYSDEQSGLHMRAGISMPNVAVLPYESYEDGQIPDTKKAAEKIHCQMQRKQDLLAEVENNKKRLIEIQQEILALQTPLPVGITIAMLEEENKRLRLDCDKMAQQVDEARPSFALGEINEAFYKQIYTGQRLPIQQNRQNRPPRPPLPQHLRSINSGGTNLNDIRQTPYVTSNSQNGNNANCNNQIDDATIQEGEGGLPWTCKMCTFQNHPLLNNCEQCDMPYTPTTSSGASAGTVVVPPLIQLPPPSPYTNTGAGRGGGSTADAILTNAMQVLPQEMRFQNNQWQQSAPPLMQNPFVYNNINNSNPMTANQYPNVASLPQRSVSYGDGGVGNILQTSAIQQAPQSLQPTNMNLRQTSTIAATPPTSYSHYQPGITQQY